MRLTIRFISRFDKAGSSISILFLLNKAGSKLPDFIKASIKFDSKLSLYTGFNKV